MNWGTKLIIGMVSFMLFIITLVVIMIVRHKDDSLVDKDYYERGLSYDSVLTYKQKAIDDQTVPTVELGKMGPRINFTAPASFTMICQKASDITQDTEFRSPQAVRIFEIPRSELARGAWLIRINYEQGNSSYLYESRVVIP